MQMINVLQRLAELDAKTPTAANPLAAGRKVMEADQLPQLPELTEMGDLRALSGLKPVSECGVMELGGQGMMDSHPRPPASFSINATAADGAEVSSMLGDILNLAGVHKVGQEHMPPVDSAPSAMVQAPVMGGEKDAMRSALDAMNEPGDEMHDVDAPGIEDEEMEPLGGMGDMGDAMAGGMAQPEMGGQEGSSPEMQSMADEIRNMADRLSQIEDVDELPGVEGGEEEKTDETWNNTPADSTNVPLGNSNDFAYNPNAGGMNKGMTNMPTATLEDQLYSEYKKFVSEAKADCCCEEKGKKACPVHGKKKTNEGLNHTPGPKIEHKDVEACVKCAETMGVPLHHENMQALHDCMESFPKFHKHITNKYDECWEDFHAECCDHYHNRNGHMAMADEQLEPGASGIAGPGVLPEGKKKKGDGNLANNYPPYDKVTRGDVIAGAKGQDQMGGKKKTKEGDDRTMSRAAKGVMKYGKEGMKKLADAGKKGKDLEPIKAKYNKYD